MMIYTFQKVHLSLGQKLQQIHALILMFDSFKNILSIILHESSPYLRSLKKDYVITDLDLIYI